MASHPGARSNDCKFSQRQTLTMCQVTGMQQAVLALCGRPAPTGQACSKSTRGHRSQHLHWLVPEGDPVLPNCLWADARGRSLAGTGSAGFSGMARPYSSDTSGHMDEQCPRVLSHCTSRFFKPDVSVPTAKSVTGKARNPSACSSASSASGGHQRQRVLGLCPSHARLPCTDITPELTTAEPRAGDVKSHKKKHTQTDCSNMKSKHNKTEFKYIDFKNLFNTGSKITPAHQVRRETAPF